MPRDTREAANLGAAAVAAGRIALGLTALARPEVPGRPWIGPAAADPGPRLLARALGARDIALGAGALLALIRPESSSRQARAWVAMGAVADALDAGITAAAWPGLPRGGRWLIAASAGGAAVAGAVAAIALRPAS